MSDRLEHITDADERQRAVALIEELEKLPTLTCVGCDGPVCGHQYVVNAAMGFKDAPRCIACLAQALEQPTGRFLDQVLTYIEQRACFQAAWDWATESEGDPWSRGLKGLARDHRQPADPSDPSPASGEPAVAPAATWDAGDMSCGDLVLELRLRLMKLEPGETLALTATDPAAPEDIPAWCNLTRHTLLASLHPQYLIRRRDS